MKRLCCFTLLLLAGIILPMQGILADSPVYARLVIPLFFEAEIPRDIDLIAERVDQLAKEKIGASVRIVPLLHLYATADPLRVAELEMLAKEGTNLDIFPSVASDYMVPIALDGLLDAYGQDILAQIGEFRISYARANGPIYRLDSMNDYVASVGITMRTDIIEKHGIDLSGIHTLSDLDALFAYVSEREPDLWMTAPPLTHSSLITRYKQMIIILDSFFLQSQEDPSRLENFYATDAYRETIKLIRKWHEAGYLPDHLALQDIRASQIVSAGELFSYMSSCRPSTDFEESRSCGMQMVTISLEEPIVTSRSLYATKWSISSTCTNPGKAMQFLSLLYTDSELVNLLMYGIEGAHYVVLEDGTIDYPAGITAETVGYSNTLTRILPNQMVSRVWRGNDPDMWEKLRVHNESAPVSDILYFSFDASMIDSEYTSVNAVINKYAYGLETGQLDPDVYLPILLEEMEAAGSSRVLAQGQVQFDAFFSERDVSE